LSKLTATAYYCVFITILYLKTSILAFAVISISGLNCMVNKLDKRFVSSKYIATSQVCKGGTNKYCRAQDNYSTTPLFLKGLLFTNTKSRLALR